MVEQQELTLEQKARIARAEYQRKWRQKNRDKEREYHQRYWARKYEEMTKAGMSEASCDKKSVY